MKWPYIEREPIADEREPVGEVKGAKARPRIIIAKLVDRADAGGRAEEASQKTVNRDAFMALAAPDHGALEAEFEVFRGPEADLLDVDPGVARINHVRQIRI